MMVTDTLAYQAVNAMYRRKVLLVPGFINRIFLLIVALIPNGIIVLFRRHSKLLPPDKP
jgi:hypothetical protein